MAPVQKTVLAPGSRLHDLVDAGDFLDCYSVETGHADIPAAEIARRIFTGFPRWVRAALAARDLAVAPFGLKTTRELRAEPPTGPEVRPGESINFFRIRSVSGDEIILGEDDRHLDFRISVSRSGASPGRVSLATWVRTHNALGRLYLRLILPGHILIVRSRLRALARELAA